MENLLEGTHSIFEFTIKKMACSLKAWISIYTHRYYTLYIHFSGIIRTFVNNFCLYKLYLNKTQCIEYNTPVMLMVLTIVHGSLLLRYSEWLI